jgi:transposase
LEIIEDYLPAIWEPNMEFKQDNAPIYTAKIIKNWFDENGIPLVDWPPYSPDLNPIEHGWAKLKERIYMLHPDLELFDGTKSQLKEQFYKAIEDAWQSLEEDYFDSLIRSMERRVNAVLEAKGWYTRY